MGAQRQRQKSPPISAQPAGPGHASHHRLRSLQGPGLELRLAPAILRDCGGRSPGVGLQSLRCRRQAAAGRRLGEGLASGATFPGSGSRRRGRRRLWRPIAPCARGRPADGPGEASAGSSSSDSEGDEAWVDSDGQPIAETGAEEDSDDLAGHDFCDGLIGDFTEEALLADDASAGGGGSDGERPASASEEETSSSDESDDSVLGVNDASEPLHVAGDGAPRPASDDAPNAEPLVAGGSRRWASRKNTPDASVTLPNGGTTNYYLSTKSFQANCMCDAHGPQNTCRLTRTQKASASASQQAQGRPLGFMASWLLEAGHFPTANDHKGAWGLQLAAAKERRVAARAVLRTCAAFEALAMRERPRREGEGSEPEDAPWQP